MRRVINRHFVDNLVRLVDTIYAVHKIYKARAASKPDLTGWSLNQRDEPALTCDFPALYLIHTPAPPFRPQAAAVVAQPHGLPHGQLCTGPVERSLFRVCAMCSAAPQDTTKKVGPRAELQLQCSGASPTERTRPTHDHAKPARPRHASDRTHVPDLRGSVRLHALVDPRHRGAEPLPVQRRSHLDRALAPAHRVGRQRVRHEPDLEALPQRPRHDRLARACKEHV